MRAKTWFALSAPWMLGLVLCAGATADDSKADRDDKGDRKAGAVQTIRGVIAGITIEGELAVDYRTRRAVEAEATLLTVVGSPRHDEASGDRDKAKSEHHRHNVYVLVLSPRTQVRDASKGDAKDKDGQPSSIDALELGERVEVKFTPREDDKSAGDAEQARRAKHGRHRTYFGDAVAIAILPHSAHDTCAKGDGSQDKDQK